MKRRSIASKLVFTLWTIFALLLSAGVMILWTDQMRARAQATHNLVVALEQFDQAGVEQALAEGADPNVRLYGKEPEVPGSFLEALRRLLTPKKSGSSGASALWLAIMIDAGSDSRDFRTVKAFLNAGADVDTPDAGGTDAIGCARSLGFSEESDLVRLLRHHSRRRGL